jgi:hypothetical protein
MQSEIIDNCLIVFNSYRDLNLDRAQEIFKYEFENKYNKKIDFHIKKMLEPAGIRGNLPGYLSAYARLREEIPEKELDKYNSIIFIHDAGLATRLFPLTYESGSPLKSTIRFPDGFAVEILFACIAKHLPLIKDSVVILPVDQYFEYTSVDEKALQYCLENYTLSMLLTPVPIKRALHSLGTVKLGDNNKIAGFLEKTDDEKNVFKFSKESTLANTFQLITTKENLKKLHDAFSLFLSKPENEVFITQLDQSEWSFNKLVCEALSLAKEDLSDAQIAMKIALDKIGITLGGVIANGFWEDWSSNITAYIELLKKLVKKNEKSSGNDNYFVRSRKIVASGNLKSCIFIDCDTIDLFGDFENCIFVNCDWVRMISAEKADNALFYSLKKMNFLRRDMSNYVYSRFISGRRHIDFECEINVNLKQIYTTMNKVSSDWVKYHEVVENPPTVDSDSNAPMDRPPRDYNR